jgi:hypothetical protein
MRLMTMINKKFLLALMFSGISGILLSQDNDFGIWYGMSGTYRLDKHFETKLSASLRTIDNASKTDQYFAEGGICYHFNDYLSSECSYRIINKKEIDSAFHFRHKLFLNIKGTLPAGRFNFDCRLMYQKSMKSFMEYENDIISRDYARLKLKANYSGPTSPLKPFVSFESFVPIFNNNGFDIKKTRSSAGVEVRISNHSSFEAAYIYEKYNKAVVPDMHILSVSYDLIF